MPLVYVLFSFGYDQVLTRQVAADLSHIASPAQVEGFLPADNGAERALKDADIVVIPAGVPRKPGMTRDDLFVSLVCRIVGQS
jgi:malate dehydrogenase